MELTSTDMINAESNVSASTAVLSTANFIVLIMRFHLLAIVVGLRVIVVLDIETDVVSALRKRLETQS
jgi:hypothetical protein